MLTTPAIRPFSPNPVTYDILGNPTGDENIQAMSSYHLINMTLFGMRQQPFHLVPLQFTDYILLSF